jgi:hypothetical protein
MKAAPSLTAGAVISASLPAGGFLPEGAIDLLNVDRLFGQTQ